MDSMFRKLMYFSFGALTITKEKTEQFFDEMVAKGEISSDEAKTIIDETIKKGEEQKAEVRGLIRSEINKMRDDFSLVRRSELQSLEDRITELERKLNDDGKMMDNN